jgi:CRISPR-associated exonuclease Cas4
MDFKNCLYSEEDLLPVSALQHFMFCPRQCALIHLEQIWSENVLTAEGRLLHERADSGKTLVRGDLKTVTGLWLRSLTLGLSGRADVVEFHREGKLWRPFPVEYKRGRPKKNEADLVQLCAQALCLEEMLATDIPEGAMFYGQTKRRLSVTFDCGLREQTRAVALAVHALLQSGVTPAPADDKRCPACSLFEDCLPGKTKGKSASRYLEMLRADI